MTVRAHRTGRAENPGDTGGSGHASAFEVTIIDGDNRSPEEWARAIFEEAPPAIRSFVEFGWRYVLGLRLASRSSRDQISGWTVRGAGPRVINLEVQSWFLTATKQIQVTGGTVSVRTVVRYKRGLGRIAWILVTPVHYVTEPYLLGHAASQPNRS